MLGYLCISNTCQSCLSDSECYADPPYCNERNPFAPLGRVCAPRPQSEYVDEGAPMPSACPFWLEGVAPTGGRWTVQSVDAVVLGIHMGGPLLVLSREVFRHEEDVLVYVPKLREWLKAEPSIKTAIEALGLKVQAWNG